MTDNIQPLPEDGTERTRQHFGDFTLLEPIGEGGSAVVYRALNRTFSGIVALKRWRITLSESQRRKFLSECNLQWKLSDHANIVRLYWADAPADEPPWLATELYETSLAERLRSDPPLARHEALGLADDILAGLEAIHAERMLHRDVKPANVLLKRGTAALADLGITMHMDAWTRDAAAGTETFVAPELERGAPPDFRSDVYSAAVTIRMMLGSDVPAPIESLLTRATSHDPKDRPADASDLRRQLWKAREEVRRHDEARRATEAATGGWVLAIDLGSTTTAAAIREPGQAPRLLDIDGQTKVPTIVFVDDSGRVVVGTAAEQLAHSSPANALTALKGRIGDPTSPVLAGRAVPVGDLVGALLKFVYDEAVIQQGGPPGQVRLTHPATWNRPRIADLLAAAAAAGLPDPVPVPEPVAAAAGAGPLSPQRKGDLVAIYDLGGGTFDTAVLRVTVAGFDVAGRPAGDSTIGGDLFDELVVQHLGALLEADTWHRLQTATDSTWAKAAAAMRAEARRVKEALSQHDYAEALIALPEGLAERRITRDEFDQLVEPYVLETAEVVSRCLDDLEVAPDQLAAFHIVGGASRSPVVERLLRGRLPDAPIARRGDPKGAVALGATSLLLIDSQREHARQPSHEGWTVARPSLAHPGTQTPPPAAGITREGAPTPLLEASPVAASTRQEPSPPAASGEARPTASTSETSQPLSAPGPEPPGNDSEKSPEVPTGRPPHSPAMRSAGETKGMRGGRSRRRIQILIAAVVALAAAVGGAKLWMLDSGSSAPPPNEGPSSTGVQTWQFLKNAPNAVDHAAAAVWKNNIWLLGGLSAGEASRNVMAYDPVLGSWRPGPPLPTPLHHAMAVTYRNELVVIGGFIPKGNQQTATTSNRVYVLRGDKWLPFPYLHHARAAGAAAVVRDKIIVVGGKDVQDRQISTTEIFDGSRWQSARAIPVPGNHLAAVSDGSSLYALGGRNPIKELAALQRYDPATDKWTRLLDMPTARDGLGAVLVNGRIIAIGGETLTSVYNVVESYDIATARWRTDLPRLRIARAGLAVASVNGLVYALTGARAPNHEDSTGAGEMLDLSGATISPTPSSSNTPTASYLQCPGDREAKYSACLSAAVAKNMRSLVMTYTTNAPLSHRQDAAHYHLHFYTAIPNDQGGTTPSGSIMQASAAPKEGSWFNVYNPRVRVINYTTEKAGKRQDLDTTRFTLLCVRVARGDHLLAPDKRGGFETGNCAWIK